GSIEERPVDVRIVAASNRDLRAEVDAGRFRADLYYRLSAATVWLPPLRARPREIPILAAAFVAAAARDARTPSDDALRRLAEHAWPGNVRELRNCVEFLAATAPGTAIGAADVDRYLQRAAAGDTPSSPQLARPLRPIKDEIRELERARMIEALR